MMKPLILLMLIIMTALSTSPNASSQEAKYKIRPGKLHKGGNVLVSVLEDADNFKVKMRYEISKKTWLPVPANFLKGETIQDLPLPFKDERGYLELEQKGTITTSKVKITFIRRVHFKELQDAYEILVNPINGKFKTKIIYHPQLPSIGWANVEISFIDNNPLFNGYEVIADINLVDEYTLRDI